MSNPVIILLIICVFGGGCDLWKSTDGLVVKLDFQRTPEGNVISLPVLHLVNRGDKTVYVYILPYGHSTERVDSLSETIELDFVERESMRMSPNGYPLTTYEFTYPKFLEIAPSGEIRLYSNFVKSSSNWELLKSGYGVLATVGYFTEEELFVGKAGHELMYSIHEFQRTVSSPVVLIKDLYIAQ